MFAKLENGVLTPAPKFYTIDGRAVFTNSPAIHLSQGYKTVRTTPPPEAPEEVYSVWEETDTEIVQTWIAREVET